MNGCIIKGTPIVVDVWRQPAYHENKVYFLTHMHADHIKGLTSLWNYKFYTSPVNCALLKEKFQFKNGIVVPLELDDPHIISIDEKSNDTITVTLIEANHVPGSVIYLFQGSFGDILYCGDMRFYPEIFEHPILHETRRSGGIDQLYLDNTFCHPNYNFPSRKVASKQVLGIIEQHPNHIIKIGIRSLGKEDLLEEVAQKFHEIIHVDDVKYMQLKVLKRPSVYTTDMSQSRIHALSLNRIHQRNHEKWNETHPTISIRLTAIEFGVSPDERPLMNLGGVFTVPYSDHSSWNELMTFVAGLKPRKIFPIVKHDWKKKDRISLALKGRDDMSIFDNLLSPSKSYSTKNDFVDKLTNSEISTNNFVGGKCVRESVSHKKRKRIIQKGVLFSSFDDENSAVCNIGCTDQEGIASSGTNNTTVLEENAVENISKDRTDPFVVLQYGLSSAEDRNVFDCQDKSLQHPHCVSYCGNNKSINPSCGHYSNHDNLPEDVCDNGYNIESNFETNLFNLSLDKVDGDKLFTSALRDSDDLLKLMQDEPNIEVDTLLSTVESLTESLEEVNRYLTTIV